MTRASRIAFRSASEAVRQELHAGTVKINGTDYDCALHVGTVKPDWDDKTGATKMVQTAVARIPRALLEACPSISARVIARGLEWFIESLGEQSTDALVWQLHLKRIITKASS